MTVTEAALAAWTAHNLPDGHGARARGRPTSTTRRTSAGRAAATSRSSRSTRRPARSSSRRYVAVDDVGTVINPMIVDGQVHGGIAQGVAQALYEEAVYDEDGQPRHRLDASTTSSRRPPSCPNFELDRTETPEPDEPDGRQGRGRDGHDRLAGRRR